MVDDKKKRGGQSKDPKEKKVRYPLNLKGSTIEWIEKTFPVGKRNDFIERLVESEKARLEALMPDDKSE